MLAGSLMCLCGIMFFGMGRNLWWWCIVAFIGCFGSPIYQTYQTVILRERVPLSMQGRIFSLQGIITSSLTPLGYIIGSILADYMFEPFMQGKGKVQNILSGLVGSGKGAGMGLMFVIAGMLGIIISILLYNNYHINLHSFRFAQSQIAMKVAELLFYFPLFCYTPYSRYTTEHGGGSRIDSSILE